MTAALLAIGACQTASQTNGPGGSNAQQCPAGVMCQGVCTNPQSDPNNCGACGNSCGGLFCSQGQCTSECAPGETPCGQACENLQTSFLNCGTCGNTCASGVCTNGVCEALDPNDPNNPNNPGTGGNSGTGGSGNGGGMNVGDPPGFWRYGDLHGCAWTGVDKLKVNSRISPQDFTMRAIDEAYCVSGVVGAHGDYESVAMLGFNLNQDPATADCTYDPAASESMGPPGITLTGSGIAANVVKRGENTNYTFRIQIQGPNGATVEEERWCATIEGVPQGKIFVPYSKFNTKCWNNTGNPYNGEPISAVAFVVPGEPQEIPFEFCVNGFALGDSEEDAPDGPADLGDQKGRVGYTNVSPDGDFDRAKVVVDGKEYIIQNNNWGNPEGTNLILEYFNNSFKIVEGYGSYSPVAQGAPASFPSIYIGANGNTAGGVYKTSATDKLPQQISNITSIQSKFAWDGTTDIFNATYDIWFAASPPMSQYNDGIDGFVMVWVHDPPQEGPIGSKEANTVNIEGYNWEVWVGPRGQGPDGYSNAPVVSFVATQTIKSGTFDLKNFITAAQSRGIDPSWYLTDVFFGFEIWQGGAGGNLRVEEFTCVVEIPQ